uniref:Glycerol-3-phosphate dehydrogenase n=1 Tax=Gongylonema pulchrum TaxID=637853 RepID=A0A183EEZ0_9BILA
LKTGEFDMLVIGGGATGAGVALDAQTRGLKTALVELDDFSSGTSSRSTKLIHGGVRYLQAAIFGLDLEQFRMVKEALFERANLIHCAPHLSYPLPIMLPIYKLWQVPYYWFGIKAYDLVSGQHNDARMNISIILSAIRHGAKAVNHVKVDKLLKDSTGKVCGAHVVDTNHSFLTLKMSVKFQLTGDQWNVKAKVVVNATGPFTDSVRLMADPDTTPICQPSAGVHIVLPGYYSFFCCNSLLTHKFSTVDRCINCCFSVRRGDVMSAWSGLRPLVRDPNKKDTKSLARNHIIEVSKSGLVTIAGGKWTTYRHMAEETVDKAVEVANLTPARQCATAGLLLEGAHNWDPLLHIQLVQDYGLDEDVSAIVSVDLELIPGPDCAVQSSLHSS